MPGVIVPRKTVGELRKLIEETEEPIEIALSETRIRFAFDGARPRIEAGDLLEFN